MKKLNEKSMSQISGGTTLPEIVFVFEKIDAWCGVQRAYVDGDLVAMRLICD